MSRRNPRSVLITLVLALAIAGWQAWQKRHAPTKEKPHAEQTNASSERRAGDYEVFSGCRWVEHRNNDGDSFHARLPDGREIELRLYFVDTPESAFKRYRGGETNADRIYDQARVMGVSPEEAVEIGKKAKQFTHEELRDQPFTVYTTWEPVFEGGRYYALVEWNDQGKPRWLHEELMRRGMARVHTKPADLPDGTPAKEEQKRLRAMRK